MKSKSTAMASFILGLISWVPLFNFVIAPAGVYFGIVAIRKIKKEPDKYGGKGYAIAGIIICGIVTLLSYSWLALKLAGQV